MVRRALTEREYRMIQGIFKIQSPPNMIWKFGMLALLNHLFHFIASIDDTTQVTN
jgi:hypothetical protein